MSLWNSCEHAGLADHLHMHKLLSVKFQTVEEGQNKVTETGSTIWGHESRDKDLAIDLHSGGALPISHPLHSNAAPVQ